MAYTYSKIASVTIGSTSIPSIDFIAIPQNYTDLLIDFSIRGSGTSTPTASLYFNNDTSSSSYSGRSIEAYTGVATGIQSYTLSGSPFVVYNSTSQGTNIFTIATAYIPNYSSSVYYKSFSGQYNMEYNGTTEYQWFGISSILWSKSSPITSIKLVAPSNNLFVQHTTATLYGIKAEV